MQRFECAACSTKMEEASLETRCMKCGGALIPLPLVERRVKRSELESLPPGVGRYRDLLLRVEEHQIVNLGEGGTLLSRGRTAQPLQLPTTTYSRERRQQTSRSFRTRGGTNPMRSFSPSAPAAT